MHANRIKGQARSRAGYGYIALATVLFSSMEIALKLIAHRFNPLQLNLLRFAVGGLFLLPFALGSLRKRGLSLRASDLGSFALSGGLCVVASMTLYQLAFQYCRASIVAILFSCNPVMVSALAALFLKERIGRHELLAMAASLAGMFCIVNPFSMSASPLGIGLTLGSTALFALYTVMSRARGRRLGGLAATSFSFLFGSLELLALVALSHIPQLAAALRAQGLGGFAEIPLLAGMDLAVLPIFAYISLCVTGLGYAAYFLAIEKTSASKASLVFFIKPALAPLLALLVLGEGLAPSTIAGIVMIALGSTISLLGSLLRPAWHDRPALTSGPNGLHWAARQGSPGTVGRAGRREGK